MKGRNSIRKSLERDKPVFGARVRTFSTTVIQIYGQLGLDYAYFDLEHAGFSPYDAAALERICDTATVLGIEPLFRLPSGDPPLVRKVLDAGVRSIIIPRVETAAEVEQAVRASRFTYDDEPGERGFGTSPSNDWGVRPEGYSQREDDNVLIGVMLETASAVRNADEIASVPELGFAKIGTGDLSVSLGCPQAYDDPTLKEAISTLQNACRNNNVPLGTGVDGVPPAIDALEDGHLLVDIGGDIEILRTVIEDRLDTLNEHRY